MSQLFYIPQAVRIDSTGTPYPGAKANFYATGTTSRVNTYEDSDLTVPHDNPVIADSAGQFAAIYLNPATTYRCVITESDDSLLDDVDPYIAQPDAVDITILDTGGYFAGSEVETALADVGANYAKKSAQNTWTADQTFNSAELKMADNVVERPQIKDYSLTHSVLTQSTATVDLDCTTANSFKFVLTENATITLSNPSPTGKLCSVMVRIVQDGSGGGYTVTWPGTVVWSGGSAPTMTASNDAIDVYTLFTDDAGATWYGNYAQAYA
jgi:hypothetical protein